MYRYSWIIGPAIVFICCAFLLQPEKFSEGKKNQRLKILCYNIHHASPPSKPDSIDLDAIARQAVDRLCLYTFVCTERFSKPGVTDRRNRCGAEKFHHPSRYCGRLQ